MSAVELESRLYLLGVRNPLLSSSTSFFTNLGSPSAASDSSSQT
jgi:hypothetical protein